MLCDGGDVGDVGRRSNRGAGKWAGATLRGRTNVADKRWSSGQGGKGLGGVSVAATPTLSVADRKGSSAGVGWVTAIEEGKG
eukprot:scaffold2477_cov101-Amphora_coffeaeformis.AAC.2